jgi:hypothetical protein
MRRILAVLMVVALIGAVAVPAADAGGRHGHGGGAVIGLAAFALFAPLIIAGEVLAATIPYRAPAVAVAPPPYYAPAPSYYAPAPAYSSQPAYVEQVSVAPAPVRAPAPAMSRVVQHAHGRYVLRGDGVYTAYQWVWIPNPPPPPPPPR